MRERLTIQQMQNIASRRSGKCLSKDYINVMSKLEWKCEEGHIWKASPLSIKNGHWCPKCAGNKKLNIDEMRAIAEERKGKCLSLKYTNVHTKLIWQCEKGHIWDASPGNVRSGKWCPECGGTKKLTIIEMRTIAKKHGGICLSLKYTNARTKLKWQCKKGHVWETTPDKIKRGSWCPQCAGNKMLSIDEMQTIASERGGKCLSKQYSGGKTKLKWQCREGHVWRAIPNNIKHGKWCPECGGTKKLTIEKMQVLAKERGGECLSKKYFNKETKLKWKCREGHIWMSKPGDIRNGRWCPECSVGLGERICRTFFEQLFKKEFPKTRPKWLVNEENNQMELDGFNKTIGLAFEHQGKQHYRHIAYYHSKQQFIRRKKDDREKANLCKKYGVTLIKIPEVPSMLGIEEVKDFIISECKKAGFVNLPKDIEGIEINVQEAYAPGSTYYLKAIKDIAFERGGICISKHYLGAHVKLIFQCKEGHEWEATPGSIKSGSWCPECSGNKKSSIDEMKEIAHERGGQCLSAEYINDRTKLIWKCMKGHVWKAVPNNIKGGRWCPSCGGRKKLSIEQMQTIAENRGGKCLTKEYVNAQTKLKWQCAKGHIWEATPYNLKQRKSWCPECAGNKKLNIEKMLIIAKERGGNCLSLKYINTNTKLKWECNEGHIWSAKPSNIKSGKWCPICGRKKASEARKLSIGEMKAMANKRGGRCLSNEYVNNHTKLKWECNNNHVWEATPNKIKQGRWCRYCAGNIKQP